mmetsp:Transcript_10525/g.21653  ORF Transcript_10525/g.21653 Transcript_10525/m.21653 type:complete len:109 (-) Transcript_10525:55-381(-)
MITVVFNSKRGNDGCSFMSITLRNGPPKPPSLEEDNQPRGWIGSSLERGSPSLGATKYHIKLAFAKVDNPHKIGVHVSKRELVLHLVLVSNMVAIATIVPNRFIVKHE